MAVAVARDSAEPFGKPRLLFRVSEANPIFPGVLNIASDGMRVVVAAPPSQLRRLTVFDRSGKIVSRVQEPGIYVQPGMSPDGTRAVVMKTDFETGNQDIWTIDLASGQGTAITSDTPPENAPVWSADGKYVLTRRRAENTRRYIGKRLMDQEQQNCCFATRQGHSPS